MTNIYRLSPEKNKTRRKIRTLCLFLAFLLCGAALSFTAFAAETKPGQNDTVKKATVIEVDTKYTDNLATDEDIDFYKFSLTSQGYVSIDFTHTSFNWDDGDPWYLIFYTSKFTKLYKMDIPTKKSKVSTPKIGLPKGTYYIKIGSQDMCWTSRKYGVQVNYTAATDWETENNDSGSRADEIKVNQKYNGALTYFYMDNDVDYYKFTTTEKGCARLTFTHASINDDEIFWIVTLYDAEFNQLTSIDVSGKKSAVSSAYVGIPAGTYYVYVEGWEECEDMYGIQVAFTASSIWETELNDSSATADTIVKNKTYKGSLATDNDTDYYKFVMKTTDYASFTFKHTSFNEGWSFWYVTLYDKDFNEIKCLESTGKKATVYTSLVKLKKGTYYIVVEKDSYSSRTYSLRVRSAYTVKYHSTASSAASGTVTKVKYGVSTKTKTVEQLKFSVSGKTFAGWRVYREYDGKWAATKTGSDKLEWVALTNGKLPSGYSYKLYENGESVAKTAPSGVVHFYGQWK